MIKLRFLPLIFVTMISACGNNNSSISVDPKDKTDIDVYLMAGQSNMVGYSPIRDLKSEEASKSFSFLKTYVKGERNGSRTRYDRWDDSSVEISEMGLDDTHFGPEYGMMQYLEDKYINLEKPNVKKCAIIKYSQGGSALYNRWFSHSIAEHSDGISGVQLAKDAAGNVLPNRKYENKTVGDLYYNMINTFVDQLNYLKLMHNVHVVGFIWSQGCHDATREDMSLKYQENLTYFISDLRENLSTYFSDCSNLPIVVSEIPTHTIDGAPYNQNIATAQKNFVLNDSKSALINTEFATEGCEDPGYVAATNPHYKGGDMLTIGKKAGELAYSFKNN